MEQTNTPPNLQVKFKQIIFWKIKVIKSTTRERWSTKVVMTTTLLVSIALILASFAVPVESNDWKNILISVGCSILASNLIMYLTSEFMLRSRRRAELIDKWGFEAIYKTRAEMNLSANSALEKCKRQIDIIAFGLKSFREAKSDEIQRLANKGVKIRILTLAPESKILSLVDEQENQVEGHTEKSIRELIKWSEEINRNENEETITLKYYDHLPLDFYFRIDDRVFVGPYLKGRSSQQAISYEFTSGEGFSYWTKYFTSVWKD
ncbi:MAG: hypothetical protein CMF18_08435 [Idiomarinaceae bacterium]|nr:hypothetical protein [Idiomarinaceae bacterium]